MSCAIDSRLVAAYEHVQTTPPSEPETPHATGYSEQTNEQDEEAEDESGISRPVEPKKGGYDSRIEQILYENPDLEIQIVHAGKNAEGGGYIVYTIRTGVSKGSLPHTLTGLTN